MAGVYFGESGSCYMKASQNNIVTPFRSNEINIPFHLNFCKKYLRAKINCLYIKENIFDRKNLLHDIESIEINELDISIPNNNSVQNMCHFLENITTIKTVTIHNNLTEISRSIQKNSFIKTVHIRGMSNMVTDAMNVLSNISNLHLSIKVKNNSIWKDDFSKILEVIKRSSCIELELKLHFGIVNNSSIQQILVELIKCNKLTKLVIVNLVPIINTLQRNLTIKYFDIRYLLWIQMNVSISFVIL